MRFLRLLVVLTVSLGAFSLRAAEKFVEITPELKGAWVTPDGAWDGRAVLLLHGFASDMDDAGGLLKRLAGELAAHGIASLRINFRGEGDAKRTAIESTFALRVADAGAARAFLLQQPGVKPGHVGVQGWSLGASTAIAVGGAHPDWFKSMALWSGAGGDMFALVTHEYPAAFAEAGRTGTGSAEIPGWKTITLRKEYFESFRGINLDDSLAKYPGAFLTIRGANDYLPANDLAMVQRAPGRPAEAVIIGGADHIFSVFEPNSPNPARVIAVTVQWFERTL